MNYTIPPKAYTAALETPRREPRRVDEIIERALRKEFGATFYVQLVKTDECPNALRLTVHGERRTASALTTFDPEDLKHAARRLAATVLGYLDTARARAEEASYA